MSRNTITTVIVVVLAIVLVVLLLRLVVKDWVRKPLEAILVALEENTRAGLH